MDGVNEGQGYYLFAFETRIGYRGNNQYNKKSSNSISLP
jgi:hypothetical protein